MKALDATLLLRHIKIVQQSRELVSAIRSHTTLDNAGDAETALDSSLGGDSRKFFLIFFRESRARPIPDVDTCLLWPASLLLHFKHTKALFQAVLFVVRLALSRSMTSRMPFNNHILAAGTPTHPQMAERELCQSEATVTLLVLKVT